MKRTTLQRKIDEEPLFPVKNVGSLHVALVYPNDYTSAVSNLGYNAVYAAMVKSGIHCERFFYSNEMRSIEGGRKLTDFDVWAFSISFEFDVLNVFEIFRMVGISPNRTQRKGRPFVIIGGALAMFNPNSLWAVADVIFHGEVEGCLKFLEKLKETFTKKKNVSSVLEELSSFKCLSVPALGLKKVELSRLSDMDKSLAESFFLSSQAAFGRRYLVEIQRGCTRGCRFCVAGYVYRPARFMSLSELKKRIKRALGHTDSVGLVSATVSDYPYLNELLEFLKEKVKSLSVSSMRLDAISPKLLKTLKQLGDREVTLAPEAGSQRMRDVIRKGISEADIERAISYVKESGLKRMKLYFIYGLPSEKREDLDAIIDVVKKVQKNGIIPYTSFNPFIPKPWTPFEDFQMVEAKELKGREKYLKARLRELKVRNKFESVRFARYQWVISTANFALSWELVNADKPLNVLKGVEKNWSSESKHWKYVNAANEHFFAVQKKLSESIVK